MPHASVPSSPVFRCRTTREPSAAARTTTNCDRAANPLNLQTCLQGWMVLSTGDESCRDACYLNSLGTAQKLWPLPELLRISSSVGGPCKARPLFKVLLGAGEVQGLGVWEHQVCRAELLQVSPYGIFFDPSALSLQPATVEDPFCPQALNPETLGPEALRPPKPEA